MTDTLVLAFVGVGVVLIAAGILLNARRRLGGRRRFGAPRRESSRGDRTASAPSEAIEELVNQKLARIPGLESTRVDFGTSADGSLEIWIGDERHTSVDQIGDPRIRQAVADAVAAFNG